MSDPKKLTEEQKEKALNWFRERVDGGLSCPVCGGKDLRPLHRLISAPIITAEAESHGLSYPMLGMACFNCAHLMMFNAIVIGLMEMQTEDDG